MDTNPAARPALIPALIVVLWSAYPACGNESADDGSSPPDGFQDTVIISLTTLMMPNWTRLDCCHPEQRYCHRVCGTGPERATSCLCCRTRLPRFPPVFWNCCMSCCWLKPAPRVPDRLMAPCCLLDWTSWWNSAPIHRQGNCSEQPVTISRIPSVAGWRFP